MDVFASPSTPPRRNALQLVSPGKLQRKTLKTPQQLPGLSLVLPTPVSADCRKQRPDHQVKVARLLTESLQALACGPSVSTPAAKPMGARALAAILQGAFEFHASDDSGSGPVWRSDPIQSSPLARVSPRGLPVDTHAKDTQTGADTHTKHTQTGAGSHTNDSQTDVDCPSDADIPSDADTIIDADTITDAATVTDAATHTAAIPQASAEPHGKASHTAVRSQYGTLTPREPERPHDRCHNDPPTHTPSHYTNLAQFNTFASPRSLVPKTPESARLSQPGISSDAASTNPPCRKSYTQHLVSAHARTGAVSTPTRCLSPPPIAPITQSPQFESFNESVFIVPAETLEMIPRYRPANPFLEPLPAQDKPVDLSKQMELICHTTGERDIAPLEPGFAPRKLEFSNTELLVNRYMSRNDRHKPQLQFEIFENKDANS